MRHAAIASLLVALFRRPPMPRQRRRCSTGATWRAAPWDRWEIESAAQGFDWSSTGQVFESQEVRNAQGFIGLLAVDGTAEFRNVDVRELLAGPHSSILPSARAAGGAAAWLGRLDCRAALRRAAHLATNPIQPPAA